MVTQGYSHVSEKLKKHSHVSETRSHLKPLLLSNFYLATWVLLIWWPAHTWKLKGEYGFRYLKIYLNKNDLRFGYLSVFKNILGVCSASFVKFLLTTWIFYAEHLYFLSLSILIMQKRSTGVLLKSCSRHHCLNLLFVKESCSRDPF